MATSHRSKQGAYHMHRNPVSDTIDFLLQTAWTTAVFWLLVLASIAIAVYAFRTVPGQRSLKHVSNWGFRFLIGCMWWQQSLWKLPPFYTDHPEQPFGDTGLLLDRRDGQIRRRSVAGGLRQQHRAAALLSVRADRLRP